MRRGGGAILFVLLLLYLATGQKIPYKVSMHDNKYLKIK